MAKTCTYKYYDEFGNLSNEYYANEAKYGEKTARAMFISKHLKNDTNVKFSKVSDVKARLRKRTSYKDLSKQGYIGFTSIKNNNADTDKKQRIIANVALSLKQAEKNIDRDKALDYFKFNKDTLQATDNVEEFKGLCKDAERLNKFQINKGNLIHELFKHVFDAKLKVKPEDSKKFRLYFEEGLRTFKLKAPTLKYYRKEDMPSNDVITGLRLVMKQVIDEIDALGDDFELYSEVSLASKNIKYGRKPIQGHIDLLAYSPSTNTGYIIDIKTKAEQSYLNFDRAYGKKKAPFDTLSDSSMNDTAIQTSMYSILAKQELNINILGSKVLLLTSKFTHDNKKAGERNWKISNIDHTKTELRDLISVEGDVSKILNIPEPKFIGEKNAEVLISEIFDDKLETIMSSKDTFIRNQENNIIEKDGQFVWHDAYDRTNRIVKNSKDEVIVGIGKVYEEHLKIKKHAARDLVTQFNTGVVEKNSVWSSYELSKKAISLLRRFRKDIYTLESATNIHGIGDDIIIATNKLTGEVTLISIALTFNKRYNFNETDEETAKTTIYGPFLDDISVKKKYGKGVIPEASTQNLNKLKLAMLAVELKALDPVKYANISEILSTSLLENSEDTYEYTDVQSQMGHLTEIHKLMKTAERVIPSELETIVKKSEFSKPDAFTVDYFDIFTKKIMSKMDPLRVFLAENPTLPNKKTLIVKLKKSINTYNQNKYDLNVYNDIAQHLSSYIKTIYSYLLLEHKTADGVYRDPRFIAANRAFLSFKNLMVAKNPTFRKNTLGKIHSLSTSGNEIAEKVHLSISEYEQKSRDMILEIMSEHQKLQKDLLDETPGVNLTSTIFDKDNFKKVFGPILKDNYSFDSNDVDQWMQFKDPEELQGAQKAYVEFFNKVIKDSSLILFGKNKYDMMYSKNNINKDSIKKWDEGFIPIISSTADLDLQEVSLTRQGIDASFKMIKKILSKGNRSAEDSNTDADPWEFTSLFPDQVDNSPGRGSKQSRYLLNITDENTVIENSRNIELNPASILNVMLVEAARKKHMAVAAFASYSVDAELAYKDMYAGVDTKPLRELINNINKIRVHSKVDDDGAAGKVIDSVKNFVSIGLFFGSIGQTITEIGTATAQMTSQSIANIMNKTLFKGTNKYDNKDLAWAAKLSLKPLGRQIITDLGMYNTSLGEFTDNEYVETRKKLAYQTKWGFWPIRTTLRQATQTIIFAQMHKEGITEESFMLDTNTGKYHYDETKDKRFYVYDENLDIENQKNKPPITPEDIAKHKLWLAHRAQLLLEGGINVKSKRMTRPFIVAQLQSMKNQSIRMIGAMDNSEAMAYEVSALGRAFGTYKRWIVQKISNYWTPTHKSFKEGRWDLDSNGDPVFVEEDFEGIIQSITGLVKDIKDFGITESLNNLNTIKKRNLSKFLADLLLTAAMAYLVSLLIDSELADSNIGKELVKGFTNASSDIMPLVAVKGAVTGSPMAAVSIALNTSKSLLTTIGYGVTGDLNNAISSADRTLNVLGAYRASKSFSDLLIEYKN